MTTLLLALLLVAAPRAGAAQDSTPPLGTWTLADSVTSVFDSAEGPLEVTSLYERLRITDSTFAVLTVQRVEGRVTASEWTAAYTPSGTTLVVGDTARYETRVAGDTLVLTIAHLQPRARVYRRGETAPAVAPGIYAGDVVDDAGVPVGVDLVVEADGSVASTAGAVRAQIAGPYLLRQLETGVDLGLEGITVYDVAGAVSAIGDGMTLTPTSGPPARLRRVLQPGPVEPARLVGSWVNRRPVAAEPVEAVEGLAASAVVYQQVHLTDSVYTSLTILDEPGGRLAVEWESRYRLADGRLVFDRGRPVRARMDGDVLLLDRPLDPSWPIQPLRRVEALPAAPPSGLVGRWRGATTREAGGPPAREIEVTADGRIVRGGASVAFRVAGGHLLVERDRTADATGTTVVYEATWFSLDGDRLTLAQGDDTVELDRQ